MCSTNRLGLALASSTGGGPSLVAWSRGHEMLPLKLAIGEPRDADRTSAP